MLVDGFKGGLIKKMLSSAILRPKSMTSPTIALSPEIFSVFGWQKYGQHLKGLSNNQARPAGSARVGRAR